MNRRIFICASSAIAIGSISGCLTHGLYENIDRPEYRTYTETVSQILISADGKNLVFIGEDYHYIFDAPEHFAQLLDSPLHKDLTATFNSFSVSTNGAVTGFVRLELDNIGEKDAIIASQYDFRTAGKKMWRNLNLSGKRYQAGSFQGAGDQKHLNTPYIVNVKEELPRGGKRALVLLTPVTVAADGVLMILSLPLLPVLIHDIGKSVNR
ncbi:hypothetical protein [Paraburkholderia adhaesiva]|uniref:hypothetical protein n=1 Tax=Paraburkholderia adhaesiva TaxID=2883244 RepID=UPI001F342292|nr:hypothetical protein [Paraburkholderia adhaesiva]